MRQRRRSSSQRHPLFVTFQNQVRGAAHPHRAISAARDHLPLELYPDAVQWLNRTPFRGFPSDMINYPHTYGQLRRAPDLTPTSLTREFHWATATLAAQSQRIHSFTHLANTYSTLLCASKYDQALNVLDTIEAEFGKSLWAIEMRIALLEQYRGTASQKEFVSSVKQLAPSAGELSYFAHYTSVRNEAAMIASSFRNIYLRHNAAQALPERYDAYFRFHLLPLDTPECRELAFVLGMEQSSSIIDLYETTLRIARLLHRFWPDRFVSTALPCLDILSCSLTDVRIEALRWRGQPTHPYFDLAAPIDSLAFDSFLKGDYETADRECRTELSKHADAFEILELLARVQVASQSSAHSTHGPFADTLIDRMASILSKDHRAAESYSALLKLSKNHWYLPWAPALLSFCQQEYGGSAPLYDAAHATASPGVRPLSLYPPNSIAFDQTEMRDAYLNRCASNTIGVLTEPYLRAICSNPTPPLQAAVEAQLAEPHLLLFRAEQYRLQGQPEDALRSLALLDDAAGKYFSYKAIRARARVLLALGSLTECIKYVTTVYVSNQLLESLLPITSSVPQIDDVLRDQLVGELSLPILYHIYMVHYGDSLEGLPQFTAEDFLAAHGLTRPSELRSLADTFDRGKLIYYLRYICVAKMMDTHFSSTTELNEERIAICQLLADLDPDHKGEYQAEITEMSRRQLIKRRMKEIDQSKIYVDIESIRRIADTTLRDSFSRYMALPAMASDLLERVVEAIRKSVTDPKEVVVLRVPDDEKAAALQALLSDLRDLFVANSEHGLDGYLSVRIRHGTLEGQLRGALEHANLLTSRERDTKEYKPNTQWANRLLTADSTVIAEIAKRLGRFSGDFDGIITRIKSEWIQIKTTPRGPALFDFTVTDNQVAYMVAAMLPSMTFDQFLDLALVTLWARLDRCLGTVREMFATTAKTLFDDLLATLQTDLARIARGHVGIAELDDAIKAVRTDLTNTLNRVAQWFQLPKQTSTTPFPIEDAISIAAENVRRFHQGCHFDPIIRVSEVTTFPGLLLPGIVDMFIILFENVVRHSELLAPRVTVTVTEQDGWTTFNVRNEVGPNVYSEAAVAHLAKLRSALERGDYRKSGLVSKKCNGRRGPVNASGCELTGV